jgi:ribosome biogenesis GTP-binding protein YsxC/EngB
MTQVAKGKKIQKSQGYIAAASAKQFPSPSRREIAFAGRSNVGKSTLINALSKRRNLARTSKTPGKTRLVFFYETERADLYFVDLPGYGYAKASRDELTSFSRVTDDYFKSGRPIGVVLLLIDIRHRSCRSAIRVIGATTTTVFQNGPAFYRLPPLCNAVRGDTVLRRSMHLLASDLHFKRNTAPPNHGRVE